jgi:hypothetical protein
MIDALNLRHQGRDTKAAYRAVNIVTAIYLFHAIAANNNFVFPTGMIEAMTMKRQ